MKNKTYKILVLSDMKEATNNLLKSAISLTNIINGEIHFYHVKKPVEIVKRDNQFSAMRSINEEHKNSNKKINETLNLASVEYGVNINYKSSIGNVKTEIKKYISELKPDVIILGKRKPKIVNFLGDNITQFVLKNFNGAVMLVTDKNRIEPNNFLSLGVLNDTEKALDVSFADALIEHSQKPLKAFKIIKKHNKAENKILKNNNNTAEFVFEENSNVINSVSKYLAKTNIDLLCVERLQSNNFFDNLDVSLLLVNSKTQQTTNFFK